MLLAVDIGNTNIVAGVFSDHRLIATWRIATETRRMADEFAALFLSLLSLDGLDRDGLNGAIVAGVVPSVQAEVCEAIRRLWGFDALVVSSQLDLGIRVRYRPPHGVGTDRLANAIAAVELYGTPAIVVDFGTGTNFDVIDSAGAYIGGAIAPGLEIAADALYARTAQLPHVPLTPPSSPVGGSTVESLQSGILFGYAGLVDGLVERIAATLDTQPRVIATGGLSGVVGPLARTVNHVNPDLTLLGLHLIYERHSASTDRTCIRENQSLA